jgi:diguanylate cyclase (GGDEF)-like protein
MREGRDDRRQEARVSPRADPTPGGADLLIDAIQRLAMAHTLDDVVDVVRVTARELTGADGATFVLRDGDQCYYVDENAVAPLWRGMRFPLEDCVSGWAMLHRETAVIEDIYADERVLHEAYRPTFVKSLAMVPIRSLDPIGAIGNYWAEPHVATASELRLLQALADTTSVALAHVQVREQLERRVHVETELSRLSETDDLTGLYNRRGFWARAAARLAASPGGALAYLDLDGLKELNDTHGHAVGDATIKAVGGALRRAVGPDDVVARLGGDEFAVYVCQAPDGLDALRDRLVAAVTGAGGSASIGVAAVESVEELTVDALVARADALMYADKQLKSSRRAAGGPGPARRPRWDRGAR